MSNPPIFGTERSTNSRRKRRRPTGVSRRQRKKQLGFETLEDRRVMSASSPLASQQETLSNGLQVQVQSYSSATAEGQTQILLNELNWQSLIGNSSQQFELTSRSIPTDPLLGNQWPLINSGQEVGSPDFQPIFGVPGEDINVAPVWNQGITGAGVTVAVIDTGVQVDHPDLADNISSTLQLNAITGANDGNPFTLDDPHGTAVAGLIGAVANNGIGGSGVAPGVTLAPINLIGGPGTEQSVIDAFRFATSEIDITNNSWGPPDDVRSIEGPTPDQLLALRDSVIFGRPDPLTGESLGVIHVWAAGNGAGTPFDFGFESIGALDSATYDGWVSSRYTIGVTGVDHDGFYNNVDGTVTGYAEAGPNVLVAAPTGSNASLNIVGDTGLGSGVWTTDTTGESGFNIAPDPNTGQEFDRDFLPDTDYTSRFNGTSAAAPLVSGVIALMLEANPSLSWRDVQEILVRSARQNAKFDIPETVITGQTQNTWIINQLPIFRDPDPFDPLVDPFLQTLAPKLDPTLVNPFLESGGDFFQPMPQVLTNGAGYTVSQGRGVNGEEIGYAQGVVDAELAVQLAQQWTTKNQKLPDELTFTSFIAPTGGFFIPLPAQEVANDDALNQTVPGGLGGDPGFIALWNEYFTDDPFADFEPEERGTFVPLTVPDTINSSMTVETVEVKISLGGDGGADDQFLENVRVLLVSPDGTFSELNDFFFEDPPGDTLFPITFPAFTEAAYRESGALDALTVDSDPDNPLAVTFSTNRNWGERSDDSIIFDPTTAEPASGIVINQGWQLYFENYSNTGFQVTGIEVAWHGSPIGANTQRIQGLVGVDDGVDGVGARDDAFNFSRVNLVTSSLLGDDDPTSFRFGEVTNEIDLTHESMGANVTVTATRVSDGAVVAQFVTGADGNYYFDLVPDDYIISLEDPLGRTALDDTLSPAGFLKDFQTEWLVTEDFFQVWDYDTALEVPIDPATSAPFPFLDAVTATATVYGVKHINFLLDPGAPPATEVNFSGSIFADINGDGVFNGGDIAVPSVGVFGDMNRNGELDAGEILVTTNAAGEYSLTVPVTNTTVMNVGVRPPADWTASNPDTGAQSFFVELGDVFAGVDFFIQPPAANLAGDGSPSSGIILGTVFNDRNGDMLQQADEFGVPNQTVYLDANNSGTLDVGEAVTQTNSNGAYVFANVADGSHFLRMVLDPDSGISQTFPDFELPQFTSILAGGTATAINFGISAGGGLGGVFDYGDLPDVYGTRLEDDGARHPEGSVFLGTKIDPEPDGIPTIDALGDDNNFLSDEDGVVLVGGFLVPDSTGTLTVTASLFGGYLQAWMDFDNNGAFEPSEQVIVNELLVQGANTVTFDIPSTLVSPTVYVRFRLGEFGLGSTGLAQIGEVEDYVYALDPGSLALAVIENPDFDDDGDVDGSDFLAWQRGVGTNNASPADGDANSDDNVDGEDLNAWTESFGQSSPSTAAAVAATGDFDSDGDTDGADFLAFQRGYSIAASLSGGDGNQDGSVDGADLQAWSDSFDVNVSSSSTIAAVQSPSSPASFSLQHSNTATASTVTTHVGTVAAYGPRMSQPGFREELVASVVDTGEASATIGRQGLAAIASEVDRLALQHRRERTPIARLENNRLDTIGQDRTRRGHSLAQDHRSLELRDRVLDRLFAKRHKTLEELTPERLGESDIEEAFAVALGEEIDWRLR